MTLSSFFLWMKMKSLRHIKLSSKFLAKQGEHWELYIIPSTELDNILCTFLVGVRQKTARIMNLSTEGIYRYGYSLIKDHEFSRTREVLKCKRKKNGNTAIYQSGLIPFLILTLPYSMKRVVLAQVHQKAYLTLCGFWTLYILVLEKMVRSIGCCLGVI